MMSPTSLVGSNGLFLRSFLNLWRVTGIWPRGEPVSTRHRIVPLLLLVLGLSVLPAAAHATAVYSPFTGHWYQEVSGPNLTWHEARAAAAARSYAGYSGHLVTVNSEAEHQFLVTQVSHGGEHWIGAYQDRSAPDYWE